jgi:hypothetical protein
MGYLSDLYGRRLESRRRQINANLLAMAQVIDQAQKEVLNTPYPPASRRGEAPRRRTGFLRQSAGVKVNLDRGSIQLINDASYWKYLQATRPYQDLALERARPQLDELRQRGMPFGESE